jgi:DNA uptake protein ComE-like DNA-binding protein
MTFLTGAALILATTILSDSDPLEPQPINPNIAGVEELMTVPGVTLDVAKRIVERRPYASVDELVLKADLPLETVRVAHRRFAMAAMVRPLQQSPVKPRGGSAPAMARINVNTATADELRKALGADDVTIRRVLAGRPYQSVSEFLILARLPPEKAAALTGRFVVADAMPPESPRKIRRPALSAGVRVSPTPAPPIPLSERLDINTATPEQIRDRCGIDPMTAMRIVTARPYASLAELHERLGFARNQVLAISRCMRIARPERHQ